MKWFLKSKTIWGIIMMIAPQALPLAALVGIPVMEGDVSLLGNFGESALSTVGAGLAIFGRFKAGGISLKP